nr:PUTATIVE PSEUDOGENE: RecName: Full=Putative protein SSX10 [Homo sapiens]
MNGDDAFARRPRVDAQIPEKIQKAFDDIAKYFSKEEWEKMKASEKILYVYMKRKYEAMTKLGFKATLPPFMCNKRTADFQGNDFDNDYNHGHQGSTVHASSSFLHVPQMTISSVSLPTYSQMDHPSPRTRKLFRERRPNCPTTCCRILLQD